MAYWDFKDLLRKSTSDKILPDEALDFVKNECELALMVYKFLDKKFNTHKKQELILIQFLTISKN